MPDDSGDVFLEPYDVEATNDVWKRLVTIDTDGDGIYDFEEEPEPEEPVPEFLWVELAPGENLDMVVACRV